MTFPRRTFSSPLVIGLSLAAGAAVGWWLWHRWYIPTEHHEKKVPFLGGKPTPVPPTAKYAPGRPIQLTAEGTGPLFHRRYFVHIRQPQMTAEALMAEIQCDVNRFSPGEIAIFEKTKGEADQMAVGDEFYIHIAGPWDGPVRVIDVTPTSFSFVTLKGHLEAGEIQFLVRPHETEPEALTFEIRSWARSRDKLVAFAYEVVGISKMVQQKMWTFFCDKVLDLSGGVQMGDVEVITEEAPFHHEIIPNDGG